MKLTTLMTAAGLALASSQGAVAAGDIAAGKEKSALCVACHAEDGNSPSAQFPRIGGQYASYLEHSLIAYKTGERKNPIMLGIVGPLSEADMADLAAYFASQKSPLRTPDLDD